MAPRTIIIAELANAHGKDLAICLSVLDAAAKAGATAFKLATYRPEDLTLQSDLKEFKINHPVWSQFGTLWDLYENIYMPWEFHAPIFERGRELGVKVFSSPFSIEAADYLKNNFDPPYYKVASFELTDHEFIRHVSGFGKPVILSTGLATLEEIDAAVGVAENSGAPKIYVLHCISEYPAPVEASNLRTMIDLAHRFKGRAEVGLSDHSDNCDIAMLAVALGARMIEKHICLNKNKFFPSGVPNPDVDFSLIPEHFAAMCEGISLVRPRKNVETCISQVATIIDNRQALKKYIPAESVKERLTKAMGRVQYHVGSSNMLGHGYRRSIMFARDARAGEIIRLGDAITVRRPGHGLHPKYLSAVEGRILQKDVAKGTGLLMDMIEDEKRKGGT